MGRPRAIHRSLRAPRRPGAPLPDPAGGTGVRRRPALGDLRRSLPDAAQLRPDLRGCPPVALRDRRQHRAPPSPLRGRRTAMVGRVVQRAEREQAVPDAADDGVGRVELDDRVEGMAAALRAVDPKYLDVLLLFTGPQLTYEEIARALGIPVGTVRSRLRAGAPSSGNCSTSQGNTSVTTSPSPHRRTAMTDELDLLTRYMTEAPDPAPPVLEAAQQSLEMVIEEERSPSARPGAAGRGSHRTGAPCSSVRWCRWPRPPFSPPRSSFPPRRPPRARSRRVPSPRRRGVWSARRPPRSAPCLPAARPACSASPTPSATHRA